jgi:hypothetical protein
MHAFKLAAAIRWMLLPVRTHTGTTYDVICRIAICAARRRIVIVGC